LDWFEKDQGAIATGLGTMGMFIGMSLGLGVTPPMVEHLGFSQSMVIFAIVSVICFILSLLFVRTKGSSKTDAASASVPLKVIKELFMDRQLVILFILSFVGLGFFNGFTTWIELILAPFGINSVQAGTVGATLILGGILGAVVVPAFSDKFRRRKPFLIGSIFIAVVTILPLCSSGNFNWLLILAGIQGFFFLPAFSLLLEMCSEWVGEARAGSATGVLMLMGNSGGVIVIMVMEAIKGTDFRPSVYLLFVLLVLAVLISFMLKESHPKRSH
jgi:MFS family permease